MPTILIVDDDKAVAAAVELVLKEAGHDVLVAYDADTARGLVAARGPDVCVLDVFMDGKDGLALASELRGPDAPPVIIMSGGGPGRSLESVTARADALGAVAMLFKPFDDDELLAAVEKATSGGGTGAG